MIEENAQVVKVEGDLAWVETRRRSSCGSCDAQRGCGTSALGKVLGQKPLHLKVRNSLDVRIGETVVIGLQDAALVRSSLIVYLLPLAAMIFAALGVSAVVPADGWVALGGLAGLALGFGVVAAFGRRAAENPLYQAVMLKRGNGYTQAVPLRFMNK